MPESRNNNFPRLVGETFVSGLHTGAILGTWACGFLFVGSTCNFVVNGMTGNIPEMNTSGSLMYEFGFGFLYMRWLAYSPKSPIGKPQ